MHTINHEQLEFLIKKTKKSLIILNVLPPESFRRSHIPGSINVPLLSLVDLDFISTLNRRVENKHELIVIYSASKVCPLAYKAALELETAGYTNICYYQGGMAEWNKEGHPIAKAAA